MAASDSMYIDYLILFQYDAGRNLVEERRCNARNELLEENGIAIHRFGYDGAYNNISYQTFNAKGKATAFNGGVSRVNWRYNEWGEKVETRYYNTNDELQGGSQHEAINRFVYDDCGFITEISYYDSLDHPIDFDGAAIIKYKYKDRTFVGIERFDKNGNPVLGAL
jgi:hypothetical protein